MAGALARSISEGNNCGGTNVRVVRGDVIRFGGNAGGGGACDDGVRVFDDGVGSLLVEGWRDARLVPPGFDVSLLLSPSAFVMSSAFHLARQIFSSFWEAQSLFGSKRRKFNE
jgi:hypothetical protein